ALGVVIRGGTPHFEYVCDAVNRGVMDLNLRYSKPVAFGVLTTDNVQQALDRVGEKGNKGAEAALALLEMLNIKAKISEKGGK
ncbi:MAG: 6,7-dimethyl-8-ribityllumazine synthase, partial [Bacteroidota bacterium]